MPPPPGHSAFRAALEQAGVINVNESCAEDKELSLHSRIAADSRLRRKILRSLLELLEESILVKLFVLPFFFYGFVTPHPPQARLRHCCR